MSKFLPLNTKGDALRIEHGTAGVSVYVHDETSVTLIVIANANIPAVAAELLKAAGQDWGNQPAELVAIAASLERYVKVNNPEKKLQERRDAVLRETGIHDSYESLGPNAPIRKAVDRIIELATILEDGASRD